MPRRKSARNTASESDRPIAYRYRNGDVIHSRCASEASKSMDSPLRGRMYDVLMYKWPRGESCIVCKGRTATPTKRNGARWDATKAHASRAYDYAAPRARSAAAKARVKAGEAWEWSKPRARAAASATADAARRAGRAAKASSKRGAKSLAGALDRYASRPNDGVQMVRRRVMRLGEAPVAPPPPKFSVGEKVRVRGNMTGEILSVFPPGKKPRGADDGQYYYVFVYGHREPDSYDESQLGRLR